MEEISETTKPPLAKSSTFGFSGSALSLNTIHNIHSGITLEQIMSTPELCNRFEIFCAHQFNEENWTFVCTYRDVEQVKDTRDPVLVMKMTSLMCSMYDQFFGENSAMELNLPERLKVEVKENWEKEKSILGTRLLSDLLNVFTESYNHVLELLKTSAIQPFLIYLKSETAKMIKPPKDDQKRVVIVGGGFSGTACMRALQKAGGHFQIILIDRKPCMEYTGGLIATFTNPRLFESISLPIDQVIGDGIFIQGEVSEMNASEIVIHGKVVMYDYLVLAMGCSYMSDFKVPYLSAEYRKRNAEQKSKAIKEAKSVLVIGGGLVGIEIATHLKDQDPAKSITLIDRNKNLLHGLDPAVGAKVEAMMRKKGINIRFEDEYVEYNPINNTHKTKKAEEKYEIVYHATGLKPNTGLIEKWKPNLLSPKRFVNVNPDLTVGEYKNIFCVGDLKNAPDLKYADHARCDGQLVAQNIINTECGSSTLCRGQKGYLPYNMTPYLMFAFGNESIEIKKEKSMLSCYSSESFVVVKADHVTKKREAWKKEAFGFIRGENELPWLPPVVFDDTKILKKEIAAVNDFY